MRLYPFEEIGGVMQPTGEFPVMRSEREVFEYLSKNRALDRRILEWRELPDAEAFLHPATRPPSANSPA